MMIENHQHICIHLSLNYSHLSIASDVNKMGSAHLQKDDVQRKSSSAQRSRKTIVIYKMGHVFQKVHFFHIGLVPQPNMKKVLFRMRRSKNDSSVA